MRIGGLILSRLRREFEGCPRPVERPLLELCLCVRRGPKEREVERLTAGE